MNTKNSAKSIKQKLLNKAKTENRRFNEILLYYGIERFLYRLSISSHKYSLFLKGGLMFMVWRVPGPRSTRDIDFLGRTNNSPENLSQICKEICDIDCEEDGIAWLSETIKAIVIQNQKTYRGIRITFRGKLDTAMIPMQIDVGFADKIHPKPITLNYPTLLNTPKPQILGYTPESIIAEKIHTMFYLGQLNSRMKDYFDVWFLAKQFEFNGEKLFEAIKKTFSARKFFPENLDPNIIFSDNFYEDPTKITQWKNFLKQNKLEIAPSSLMETIENIRTFILPIITALQLNEKFTKRWNRENWV